MTRLRTNSFTIFFPKQLLALDRLNVPGPPPPFLPCRTSHSISEDAPAAPDDSESPSSAFDPALPDALDLNLLRTEDQMRAAFAQLAEEEEAVERELEQLMGEQVGIILL